MVLRQLRKVLQEQQCTDVGAPLLSLLKFAEVTRKLVSRGNSLDTRIHLRLLASGKSSGSKASCRVQHVELQLEWNVSDRGFEAENSWSVLWHRVEGGDPVRLLHFSEMIGSSGDPEDMEYTVLPLANWLRERGMLTGDSRLQYTLLWLAVETLFQLADEATGIDDHVGQRGGGACAQVCGFTGAGNGASSSIPFRGLNFPRWWAAPLSQAEQADSEPQNDDIDEDEEDE
jgi:hypothetical protein